MVRASHPVAVTERGLGGQGGPGGNLLEIVEGLVMPADEHVDHPHVVEGVHQHRVGLRRPWTTGHGGCTSSRGGGASCHPRFVAAEEGAEVATL